MDRSGTVGTARSARNPSLARAVILNVITPEHRHGNKMIDEEARLAY